MESLLVISRLYLLALVYNFIMLVLLSWCYPETFSLVQYPLIGWEKSSLIAASPIFWRQFCLLQETFSICIFGKSNG